MSLTSAVSLHSEKDSFANPLLFQYNIAYIWPAVLPAYISMKYLRSRYLAFWAKYNYVLSAALSAAIAIAGVVIFFAVSYN